jgi:tetratricopeptide (TPR) repeat protein
MVRIALLSTSVVVLSTFTSYVALQFYLDGHLCPPPQGTTFGTRRLLRQAYIHDRFLGDVVVSLDYLHAALDQVEEVHARACVRQRLADVYMRLGQWTEAREQLQAILSLYGEQSTVDAMYWNAVANLLRVYLHTHDQEAANRLALTIDVEEAIYSKMQHYKQQDAIEPDELTVAELNAFIMKARVLPTRSTSLLVAALKIAQLAQHKLRVTDKRSWWWNAWRDLNKMKEREDPSKGLLCLDAEAMLRLGQVEQDDVEAALSWWTSALDITKQNQGIRTCDACRVRLDNAMAHVLESRIVAASDEDVNAPLELYADALEMARNVQDVYEFQRAAQGIKRLTSLP